MRYVKMTILNRFPGIGERPRERPVYGSDALHLAQRLRKDYWRQHKERGELALYKDMIAKNQRRAESVSEVRRIEGFLQTDLAYGARTWLTMRKERIMRELGLTALPE